VPRVGAGDPAVLKIRSAFWNDRRIIGISAVGAGSAVKITPASGGLS
jgi:hypothetical protein